MNNKLINNFLNNIKQRLKFFFGFPKKNVNISILVILLAIIKLTFTVFLPFLIINGITIYFKNEDLNKAKKTQEQELINLLSKISRDSEPNIYFDNEFKALANIPYKSVTFQKRQQEILKQFSKNILICVYDKDGKLIKHLSNFNSINVANNFLKAVQNPELVSNKTIKTTFLEKFSGYSTAHQTLHSYPDKITEIGESSENKWGGYFHIYDNSNPDKIVNGYMIVFITRHINSKNLLPKVLLKAHQNNFRNTLLAYQEPSPKINEPKPFQPESHGFSQEMMTKFNNMPFGENIIYIKNKKEKECCGGKIYTETGIRVIGIKTEAAYHSYIFTIIILFLKIAVIIFSIILLPIYLRISSFVPNFRFKMASIIIFGSVISLSMLIFTGIAYSYEIENNLKNEFQNSHIEELTHIDADITNNYDVLEGNFNEMLTSINPNLKSDEILENFKLYLTNPNSVNKSKNLLKDKYPFVKKMVFATNDKCLIYEGKESYKIIEPENSSFEKFILSLNEIANGKTNSDTKADFEPVSFINIMGNVEDATILLTHGKINKFTVTGDGLSFLEQLRNKESKVVSTLFMYIDDRILQEEYLLSVSHKRDKKLKQDITAPRFIAIPINKSIHWRIFPNSKTDKEPDLLRLANQAYKSKAPIHEEIKIKNKKYLVSAMPGNNLNGYSILLATPYKIITNAIKAEKKKIAFHALLIIVIALITAFYTSTLILNSMGNLQKGLQNISEGDFRQNIQDSSITEFSSMIQSLNTTMYQLGELKIAKTVQETLLPDKELSGDDWELCGKSKTATELGGDHVDWLQLSDGRILIIIGDVTGHGIAPALVQASMKVWLALNAETSPDAVSLVKEINKLHINHGANKLNMTAWLGYYTPSTGELEFTSAGHPYPILLKEDGKIEMIKLPGMPIGSTLRIRLKGEKLTLNPGSSLILYTDGFAEIKNNSGIMLGFEGLSSICASTFGMNASDAINSIFKKAQQWGPQDDDQTIVILRRKINAS